MTTYQAIAKEYLDLITRDSNNCVFLGINDKLDQLPDPSAKHIEQTVETGKTLLRKIDQFNTKELLFDEKLDLKIVKLAIGSLIDQKTREINHKPEINQLPKTGEEIGDGIFNIFVNDPRLPQERLNDIMGRIQGIPQYLSKLLDRLDTPVRRWRDIDIEVVNGLPGFFDTLQNWAQTEQYPQLSELKLAIDQAKGSLKEYTQALQNLPTTLNFAVQNDAMRKIIRLRGIQKTPEELHHIATQYIQDTKEQLNQLSLRLRKKYLLPESSGHKDIHDFLNNEYRVKIEDDAIESVLDSYHEQKEKILSFVTERNLFPIFKDQTMNIMKTPLFMEPIIPAAAMMPPPPFREGKRISTVYLTLKEDQLDEHTALGIPIMMMHEGIPGHHLQLATAGRNPSIIRKSFVAADQAEGWATMLEDYMLDIGYMDDLTDECRFIAKREISRLAARVAIDLYFMSGEVKYLDIGLGLNFDSEDPLSIPRNY